jgi:hypothetical protein
MRPFAARLIKDLARIAEDGPEAREISERQEEWLYRFAVMFRRQLPSYVVAEAQRQALKLARRQRDRRVEASAPPSHSLALPGQLDLFPASSPAGGGSGVSPPETARGHLA